MKFRCERDALAEAISTAQRAVASRGGALPVLSGLRITLSEGNVEFVGSDLELTIRVNTPADVDGTGTVVVPARLLSDIVRAVDSSQVSMEFGGDDAKIIAGRSSFSVRVLTAADFPKLTEVTGSGVRVDSAALAEALRQVVVAASKDEARPILTGVLLAAAPGGLRLVATDSYRLAVRDLQGVTVLDEGQKVLVAAKGLAEVQRLLTDGEIEVVLSDRDVLFRIGRAEVTTRLIEGEFPNYEQLIPSGYPNRLTIQREALAEAVKRVRLVSQGRDRSPIRLSLSEDGLELSAIAQEIGEARESVEAKYEGSELVVAFDSQFLLDGIDAAAAPEIVLETLDPLKPATLRTADSPDFLYLLMPVRIS